MLAFNGLSISTEFPSQKKERTKIYDRAIKIIKNKPVWVFAMHPSRVTIAENSEGGNIREQGKGAIYPSKVTFNPPEVHEISAFEIQWYLNSRKDRFDNTVFSPDQYDYKGQITLSSKTDFDEIFFLACVLPICETYGPLKEFTNTSIASPVYCVVDDEADAEKQNIIEDLETRFKANLFGDFAFNEDKLRELAAAFKIQDATNIGIATLKNNLKLKILAKNAKGKMDASLIEDFLDLAGTNLLPRIKAVIQTAREKKILATRMGNGKVIWKFLDENGEETSDLLTVMGGHDPEEKLVSHLSSNKDILENLEELVSNKK